MVFLFTIVNIGCSERTASWLNKLWSDKMSVREIDDLQALHKQSYTSTLSNKSKNHLRKEKKTLSKYGVQMKDYNIEKTDHDPHHTMSMTTKDFDILSNPLYCKRLAYVPHSVPSRVSYLPAPEYLKDAEG